MSQSIAAIALLVIMVGLMLGNYWFTFGLWPRSWGSFIFFALASIIVSLLLDIVKRDKD